MEIDIRVTGVCYGKNNDVLIIEHDVNGRRYSLPGGRMKLGENIGAALVREMQEEVGIEVAAGGVIYISEYDRPTGRHVVEIALLAVYISGTLDISKNTEETTPITSATYVPLNDLGQYFSEHPEATKLLTAIRAGQHTQADYLGQRTL